MIDKEKFSAFCQKAQAAFNKDPSQIYRNDGLVAECWYVQNLLKEGEKLLEVWLKNDDGSTWFAVVSDERMELFTSEEEVSFIKNVLES